MAKSKKVSSSSLDEKEVKNYFVYWPDGYETYKAYIKRDLKINGDFIAKNSICDVLYDPKNFEIKVKCRFYLDVMYAIDVRELIFQEQEEFFTPDGIVLSHKVIESMKENRQIQIKKLIRTPIIGFDYV